MEKRLLVLTQKIDRNDPILGFFHGWVETLARNVSFVTVICLEKGESSLPQNVTVLSLGKERGGGRLSYVLTLFRHVWRERAKYDSVFVHMNQEYVLLAGIFWKAMGKKIVLWRNHPAGGFLTRLSVALSDTVLCVSEHAYVAKFAKTKLMPAGIDLNLFRSREVERTPRTALFAGRISPIKHPDILVAALEELWVGGTKLRTSIVGAPSEGSEDYYRSVRAKAALLEEDDAVGFYDAVTHEQMPDLYGSHEVFVNLTETGSFDKTVIEAAACGCIPLVSNKSFLNLFPLEFHDKLVFTQGDARDLADKLKGLILLSNKEKSILRKKICMAMKAHSLESLIARLLEVAL